MEKSNIAAMCRAIKKLGGQSPLARVCGVKQGHVWHWLNKSRSVPVAYVLTIEAATGGTVTRHELRPDIFGKPPPATLSKCSPGKHKPPSTDTKTAAYKDLLNAHILAEIMASEARQHRAMREALLGRGGAVDYLAILDAEIAALRSKLRY